MEELVQLEVPGQELVVQLERVPRERPASAVAVHQLPMLGRLRVAPQGRHPSCD